MVTILSAAAAQEVAGAEARGEELWIPAAALETTTGFHLAAEGLCRRDLCVPLPTGARPAELKASGRVNVAALWRLLGWPVLHDAAGATWVLGDGASARARERESLEAPDFSLEDCSGRTHALSDYRGSRVLLVTWASW